jgi:SAM-dependent methyltransferase
MINWTKQGKVENNGKGCSIPCNLCGASDIEELSHQDRNGKYLRTVICRCCGLIWTDPRPRGKDIKGFYSKEYRREYKGIYEPKLKHIYRDANEALRRYDLMKEVITKDDVIFDVGSGSGVFIYVCRKLGCDASGIEPDVGHAKYSIGKLGVPAKIAFVEDIRASNSFNIITMHHVLEHMEDPFSILRMTRDLLKKDGFLIIELPNAEDIKQDPHNRYHKAHLYTFNPETLECMGKKAGFNIYKKSVAPYNGNISIIFQKSNTLYQISGDLPGNFEKITGILDKHTTLYHFATSIPYKKFLANAKKAIHEHIFIKRFIHGKDIVDSIIRDRLEKRAYCR